jgi:uncharacterized repeat protein (TIGR01451 family)
LKNTGTNNTIPDSGAAYLYLNPTALNIAKVGPPLSNAGAAITYTISITNNLPLNLTGLVLTDIIPAGAVYLSGGTLNGSVVSWTIPSLTSGQTISRQFAVTAASTITNSDFQVTAVENYTATGLLPVVTHPVTDRSYLPLFRKK